MEVHIKCVKCGDCAILREKSQLIVDCGTDNKSDDRLSRRKFAYSAIHAELGKAAASDILVSHFDADHFCGFLELEDIPLFPSIIRTAYLPWSIVDGKPIYVGALARLLAVAPPGTYGLRLSTLTLELFAHLDKVAKQIRFLRAGDTLALDAERFRILWPQADVMPLVPPAPTVSSASLFDNAGYEAESTSLELLSYADVDRDLGRQLPEFLAQDLLRNRTPKLLEDIAVFSDALSDYLLLLHGNEPFDGSESQLAQIMELAAELNRGRENLWSGLDRGSDVAKTLASFALTQYHALVNCMNALSIVFDQPGRILFTGDAPPRVVAHIADHPTLTFQGPYRLVKLPHHGTERYYSAVLPRAEAYIVSNGGYQRRPVGRLFLDDFPIRYPSCKVYCTNAHRPPAGSTFCTYRLDEGVCAACCHPIHGNEQVLSV